MVGDMWRWRMQTPDARHDMEKSWRQLMRWLVADVPKRVELAVELSADDTTGAVKLRVRARDEKFQPLDDASVSIEIKPVLSDATGVTTNELRLRAEPSLDEPGVYETTCVLRYTGGYRATAHVTNAVGALVGQAEVGWSTDPATEESRSLAPNTALLESIAQRTGGDIIPAAKLNDFARALPSRHSPVM
jgi:hypothetical protein